MWIRWTEFGSCVSGVCDVWNIRCRRVPHSCVRWPWRSSQVRRPALNPAAAAEVVLGGNQYVKLIWAWQALCNSSPSALYDSSYLFNSISLPARSRPPGYIGVFHLAGVRPDAPLHTPSPRIDGAARAETFSAFSLACDNGVALPAAEHVRVPLAKVEREHEDRKRVAKRPAFGAT